MFYNKIVITAFIAWFVSQITKAIIYMIINKKISWERFFGAAGMPSSHSAVVTAVATAVGMQCGWDSPLFAVSVVLAAIVMHDAVGVRQETGKQAKVINSLLDTDRADSAGGSSLKPRLIKRCGISIRASRKMNSAEG